MKSELAYLAHRCVELDKYRVETCCIIGEFLSVIRLVKSACKCCFPVNQPTLSTAYCPTPVKVNCGRLELEDETRRIFQQNAYIAYFPAYFGLFVTKNVKMKNIEILFSISIIEEIIINIRWQSIHN